MRKVQSAVMLHQSYVRVDPNRLLKMNRYTHVHQIKRMKGEVKKLHMILDRVVRDVERKAGKIANPCVQHLTETQSGLGADQTRNGTGVNQQEIQALRIWREGAVINRSNLVVGSLAFPDNAVQR